MLLSSETLRGQTRRERDTRRVFLWRTLSWNSLKLPIFVMFNKDWPFTVYALYQVRTISWYNRWSGAVPHVSNRTKRSNLQRRDKTYSVLGCVGVWVCGERISLRCRQVTSAVPKTMKNLCPTVLQLKRVISTWWDENMTLIVFSTRYKIH